MVAVTQSQPPAGPRYSQAGLAALIHGAAGAYMKRPVAATDLEDAAPEPSPTKTLEAA